MATAAPTTASATIAMPPMGQAHPSQTTAGGQSASPTVASAATASVPLRAEAAELTEDKHALVHSSNAEALAHAVRANLFKPGSPVTRLPIELDVAVPVRDFRVRNLLSLAHGQIVETRWSHGEDLPLGSGDVQMAWAEFEVVDTRLAVRITRLA